jgi:16S rRNA (adenine1518-N6/adenine1519-N6)-dimethyltransferase
LGQHFLVDPHAVCKIVDGAEVGSEDTVLEIGPGPGILTVHLAERARRVIAVELDDEMLDPLRQALTGKDNVKIVHGDILEQEITALVGDGPYKVVANLPYYITSAILRHLLTSKNRPSCLVVTVQREVAERIVGTPQKRQRHKQSTRMSLLAVSVQFYGQPRLLARIPAGSFRPVPTVDSAVLRIDTYDPMPWDVEDERLFFQIVRAGFAQSRKQLGNALQNGLRFPPEQIADALEAAGIDRRRRAETLSVAEWVVLSDALGAG